MGVPEVARSSRFLVAGSGQSGVSVYLISVRGFSGEPSVLLLCQHILLPLHVEVPVKLFDVVCKLEGYLLT